MEQHNIENTLATRSSLSLERFRLDRVSNLPGIADADAGPSLLNLLRLLAYHKWKILAFIAIATAATVVVSRRLEPLYESSATVRIDRHAAGIVGQEAGQQASSDMDQIMATQVEIIQSDPVLGPVAKKYDLRRRENQYKPNTPDEARVLAAPVVLKRLSVMRPPNTYLIRITYRASDPVLAAQVANDIAASYIAHAFDSNDKAYSEVSASIKSALRGLRSRMESSTANLAHLQRDLNMVDPQQGSTIQAARLQQLNQEFTAAQADRLKKEAAIEAFDKSNSLAAAQVSSQAGALDRSVDRLDTARQQFAMIRSVYGENNAEYKKAKEQVDELQRQVDQSRSDSRERLTVEFQQALGRERALAALVAATKAEVDGLSSKALQYQQAKGDAESDKTLYADLERRTAEVGINNRFQDTVIQFAERALPSSTKAFPNIPLYIALAFLLSATLSVVLVIVVHAVDSTLSDPEEAAVRFNVDVLGMIPATRNITSVGSLARGQLPSKRSIERMARYTEGIRLLRGSLGLAELDRPMRTVLFTSAEPGEGKSTTASNLALSFSQVGKRVLLIDADLRTPTLHLNFQVSNDIGVSDVLTGRVSWREAMIQINPNLFVIPAGSVLLAAADAFAQGASKLFENAGRGFDFMFVDAPPLLGFAESHQLARAADSVIVVTNAKRTSGRAVANTLAVLSRARANVLGLVMTHVEAKSNAYSYGYGYGKNHHGLDAPRQVPAGNPDLGGL